MRRDILWVSLLMLAISGLSFGQQQEQTWKEYKSPSDGFALTVPTLPTPHDSPVIPGATAYTIPLRADSGVVLRVTKKAPDCANVISHLKERIRNGGDSGGLDASSAKDISIDGHPGFEYRWKKSYSYKILERWYCVEGRLYVFSVNWPSDQPFPTAATRILDSFRLLPKE